MHVTKELELAVLARGVATQFRDRCVLGSPFLEEKRNNPPFSC